MKKFRVYNVHWVTDEGGEVCLPAEFIVAAESEDDIGDAVSDLSGFLHNGFSYEEVGDAGTGPVIMAYCQLVRQFNDNDSEEQFAQVVAFNDDNLAVGTWTFDNTEFLDSFPNALVGAEWIRYAIAAQEEGTDCGDLEIHLHGVQQLRALLTS